MKLISIIAGAALLTGCASVGDQCVGKQNLLLAPGKYCNGHQVYNLPKRFERCMSEHLMNKTFNGLICTAFDGRGIYAVSVKNKEADIAELQAKFDKETEEYMKRRDEWILAERKRKAEEEAELKRILKGKEKCMASFAKSIGIADEARQTLRNDFYFSAKSEQYITLAQEYIYTVLDGQLSYSYPQLQSMAYRQSEEFSNWSRETGQKCAKALYYSECMSANYLLKLKDAEDELIKNCKSK